MITSDDCSLSEFDSMRRAGVLKVLNDSSAKFFAVIPTDPPNPLVEFYAANDHFEEMVRTVFADAPSDLVGGYLLDLKIARERRLRDWKALEGRIHKLLSDPLAWDYWTTTFMRSNILASEALDQGAL